MESPRSLKEIFPLLQADIHNTCNLRKSHQKEICKTQETRTHKHKKFHAIVTRKLYTYGTI